MSVVFVVVLVVCLAAATAAAKTPVRLVTYGADTVFERWARIADDFNGSNDEYRLEVEIYPYAEYISKVTVMMLAGSPPDVMMTWAQYKPSWIEQGLLLDVTPYWERSPVAQKAKEEFFPFIMEAAMSGGRYYGVPHDYSFMVWILNADRLNSAGLPAPDAGWTFGDFATYALRLTNPQQGVFGASKAGHWSLSSYQWAVNANGQGWLSDDRKQVLVNHPDHIATLERWQELVTLGAVPQGSATPPAGDMWAGGYAMWEGWVHYGSRLVNSPYDWTMATMPKGAAGNLSFAQGHMWSIPSNAPNPDASWALLEWMMSPEGQETMVQVNGTQPMSNDPGLWAIFFESVQPDKRAFLQRLVLDVIYGNSLIHNMNYWTQFNDVDRIVSGHLARVFNLSVAPATAMEQAAAEIKAVMGL